MRESTSTHRNGYHDVYKDPNKVAHKWREELSSSELRTIDGYLSETMLKEFWRASTP